MKIILEQSEKEREALACSYALVQIFSNTSTRFGRFCRGVESGILSVLHSGGMKGKEEHVIPQKFPDTREDYEGAFIALYSSFLMYEKRPREIDIQTAGTNLLIKKAKKFCKEIEGN